MARDALAEIASMSSYRGGKCKLAAVLDDLEPSLRDGVLKALEPSSELPSSAISKWFKGEGMAVSDQTVLRHRKGQCVCP